MIYLCAFIIIILADKCADGTNNCHVNADCTSGGGAGEFTCSCKAGFTGDGVISCAIGQLYIIMDKCIYTWDSILCSIFPVKFSFLNQKN